MPRNVTLVALALLAGVAIGVGAPTIAAPQQDAPQQDALDLPNASVPADGNLAQFESADAFRAYLDAARSTRHGGFTRREPRPRQATAVATETAGDVEFDAAPASGGDGAAPERIGRTNVQVAGFDEPDRVKTDGRNFFVAPEQRHHHGRPETPGSKRSTPRTHVVDASDPPAPERIGAINDTGRLLLAGDTLLSLGHDAVVGYDVSTPQSPVEDWRLPLNGSIVTAREHDGTVYLVTETHTGPDATCPIEPLGPDHPIDCASVHRPGAQVAADVTYSAFAIDGADGTVEDTVSVVGTSSNSVVYVSPDAIYLTYTAETPRTELVTTFLREEFEETPDWLLDRIDEIESYDISTRSKRIELRDAIEEWLGGMDRERREAVEDSLQEQFAAYEADRQRELTRTGVARIEIAEGSLSVGATTTVPGRPLDQFSMSEHDGVLRITTTVPAAGDADSANDLYTLNATTLERRGSVTDMGLTERVYAVRYVEETAYVVTFRRVDPFHVLDLSDPDDPSLEGELKLPGFSSYLHPISDDRVLGIGEEDGQVKTVLFNVSDPTDPTIANDRVLDEGWSAVSRTHHAFAIDRRHGVFFLPAGESGLVLSYENDSLRTAAAVDTDGGAMRARYVDDHLYVFGQEGLVVLDETTWEETTRLSYEG